MQDETIYSVMTVEDTLTNQENNDLNEENIKYPGRKKELCKRGLGQEEEPEVNPLAVETDDSVPNTEYHRLDRVVFAEPLEAQTITEDSSGSVFAEPLEAQTITEDSSGSGGQKDLGEITFHDNVMVKKRAGRRNRYLIDIKDGCLDCPMSNCSKTFTTKTLLLAHVRKVHCASRLVCEACGAGFSAAYLLRRHAAVHSGVRTQCVVCGKWLSQRTDLSVHMKTHGAARQHECVTCGKRFLRLSSLRRHETFVHREGELACKVCDARFTSRKLWSRHRAAHSGAAVP